VWSCAYCDCAFTEKVVPEVDHIRPLAKGGVHEWSNLAPACASCNRLKADQDVAVWLENHWREPHCGARVDHVAVSDTLSEPSHPLHYVTT
jgi:hypothetical protein